MNEYMKLKYCEINKGKIIEQVRNSLIPVLSLIGMEWNDIIFGGRQKRIGESYDRKE